MIQAKPSAMFELIQTTLNMDTNRLTVSELCKLAKKSGGWQVKGQNHYKDQRVKKSSCHRQ